MLEEPVDDVDEKIGELHDKLRTISIEEFEKYARKIDSKFKAIDSTVATYSEFKDKAGSRRAGMMNKDTGKSHGVARIVVPDKWIVEGTSIDGVASGLVRSVYHNKVVFGLYKNGNAIASVEFDQNLKELKRADP